MTNENPLDLEPVFKRPGFIQSRFCSREAICLCHMKTQREYASVFLPVWVGHILIYLRGGREPGSCVPATRILPASERSYT